MTLANSTDTHVKALDTCILQCLLPCSGGSVNVCVG